MVKLAIGFLALVGLGSARWDAQHKYSPSVSAQIATAIKEKLLANINGFADQSFAQKLKEDLNQSDDSKRTLTSLSAISANQLFGALGLTDPGCDTNGDGIVAGDQLKCLNYAWKAYIPT